MLERKAAGERVGGPARGLFCGGGKARQLDQRRWPQRRDAEEEEEEGRGGLNRDENNNNCNRDSREGEKRPKRTMHTDAAPALTGGQWAHAPLRLLIQS